MIYRGRFAPSPTGQLHFGSLVAALASYLDAKSQQGQWLVRIEDLDPPREIAGASDDILRALEVFQLEWDESVLYQSRRHGRYQDILDSLEQRQLTYHCQCTRKTLAEHSGHYPNLCRDKNLQLSEPAIRLKHLFPVHHFDDRLQGRIHLPTQGEAEDFILRRRDGLYAYQLAVVVDDIDQGITHIVRGADLIDSTFKQAQLYHYLNHLVPHYLHLPLAVNSAGHKLSKQNYAPAVLEQSAPQAMSNALMFLGQPLPKELHLAPCQEQLVWATQHWSLDKLPKKRAIPLPSAE
ncbi:tRNA glutamyl-Q(34) synthetase GluQRS [Pleionea litopenaei]|uniref:Glutamyl-Q tRNA(Asp) synthetase n=1 Tax=Pleionea litopenaei TaxID=3070815 RepID=A0AA51X8C9_9GAMM|nr:tRNA glutamyl-Q(34) synthetase GluQRS [Pleionea sp. HL-JVS1]WMS89168.1 tRNA glutamyl-Q(34) synthetase GluQRS [Pleionea sp. HL-JVS1]